MRAENIVIAELDKCRLKVIVLENELLSIERDLAFQHYGVKIGSVVVVDKDEFLITNLRYIWRHAQPSLMGRKKILGGGWCDYEKHIYGKWKVNEAQKNITAGGF